MHGFLSVSKNKNIALNFMQDDPSKKVFITILVPKGPNEEKQGFAEMEKYSQYPMEKEVLFNVRSRFTVLETEDDYAYSAASRCRHLILLYGAQGFRKFITEQNPIQEVSIANIESGVSCAHCHVKNEKLFFVSIEKKESYYCQKCIDYGVGPFLCVVPSMNKVNTAKIKGCLLIMKLSQEQIPFYGYRCSQCEEKKQKAYFTCIDCENKWCEKCFDSKTSDCLKAEHNIILETSPFSFWCEKMSANELTHFKFQNDQVQDTDDIFQQPQMYFESQKSEKAIEFYSLYIQENEPKGKDANLAFSYHNMGIVYDSRGEYKKAIECNFKSLDIRKSVYGGDNHQLVAASYNNIGRAYHNQGEAKKALEYLFKALDIRKSVYEGENHLDIASSYNNIGLVFQNQGEYKKALEYYLKTLDIRKSVYGDNHPEVAIAYVNIGTLYNTLGEYKKALEYLLKSLDITKLVYGDNHPEVSASYNNLGQGYDNQGEYKKALECYFKSLDIQKSIYKGDEDRPQIAICYNNIGGVYHKQREYEKALEYFLKSLKIQKSVYGGDNHPQVAGSYNNIGNAYDYQGEYEKALEYYLKSLDIQISVFGGDNHPMVANSFNNIGTVYLNQGENEKALEYLFKALDIHKAVYGGENYPLVAISYSNIADVYDNQGEHKKALGYYLKGLEIEKLVYGEDHPETIETQNRILEKIDSQKEK